jgi:hypothetical protein
MHRNSLFCLIISLLLVFSVFFCGCSDESPPDEPAAPTPVHPDPKYAEGDIIATPASSGSSSLYLVLKYDAATDQYTRAIIEKNADGSWGYRSSDRTERSPRAALEKTYTVRAGHVAVSIVPVVTLTAPPEAPDSVSGGIPVISRISPPSAVKDSVVSLTISGSNFQNGATVKLYKAGSMPITGNVTSVTSFEISCLFNLNGKSEGSYNLIVTNPDGKSDSQQGMFTVGDVSPIIGGIYPVTGSMNKRIPLTISGQNFRNEVKVGFVKNSTEIVCDNPLSTESSKIICTLDLSANRGASPGEWTVTVLNIRDGKKGTWVKKFTVTNASDNE